MLTWSKKYVLFKNTYLQQSLKLLTSSPPQLSLKIINKTHFEKWMAERRTKFEQNPNSAFRVCVSVCEGRRGGGGRKERGGM